jgi:hypothetical protein
MKGQQTARDLGKNEMGKKWGQITSVSGHKKGEDENVPRVNKTRVNMRSNKRKN